MTTREAIASLKVLCHTCKHFPTCVNDKPECFQAIEMAIKSLEAWDTIREIFKAKSTSKDWEYIHDLQIWEDALEIINKYTEGLV